MIKDSDLPTIVNRVPDQVTMQVLAEEIIRLRTAIRNHRDQKGDDRCWLDDRELYDVLPEGLQGLDDSLPPKDQFLKNCERFHDTRRRRLDDPTKLVDPKDLHRRGPDYRPEYDKKTSSEAVISGTLIIQDEAAKYDIDMDDEAAEYILWEFTGFPSFWNMPEDGNSPEECIRTQVRKVIGT